MAQSRGMTVLQGAGVIAAALACTACSTRPVHYQALSSTAELHANTSGGDRQVAFNSTLDTAALKSYASITLEPVAIYRGRDHQFGKISEESKAELARYADQKFRSELGRRNLLAGAAGPQVLRMRVTLTGAEESVPVLGTVTKLTPVGLALSGVRAATDREGSFNGAITYAVELFASRSGKLVYAFVARQYPNALDIPASIRPLDAAKAGIDRGSSTAAISLKSLLRS